MAQNKNKSIKQMPLHGKRRAEQFHGAQELSKVKMRKEQFLNVENSRRVMLRRHDQQLQTTQDDIDLVRMPE